MSNSVGYQTGLTCVYSACTLLDMHNQTPSRQDFADRVRASGIPLEALAFSTGKSYASVYAYLRGTRNPSDEWLVKCGAALAAYEARRVA